MAATETGLNINNPHQTVSHEAVCRDKKNKNNMDFKIWNGTDRGLGNGACGRQDKQLNTYDWLSDVPGNTDTTDLVEVQFKNTRKGYYHNVNNLELKKGDIVAVEANPGHDIGVVTLTGQLVKLQIKKAGLKSPDDIKRIYRIAKQVDMTKYHEAKAREHQTMIESRQIAKGLGLQMKIGDVEYQGDGNKAIFYYIADERVDFRQLIKDLAAAFHVRIEMKQIGARQEAGRIGGTGPCGRELCCATWMKNFSSVSTTAARHQDISLNPTKLAGMCAKLKCCLNYEVDNYIEAGRKLPGKDIILQTLDNDYYLFKSDILSGQVTYSTAKNMAANLETISAERAHEIIAMNRQGEKPLTLTEDGKAQAEKKPIDLLADADISRFDKSKRQKKNNKNRQNNNRPRQQQARNDGNGAMENSGQHNNGDRHNGSSNNYQGGNNRRPRGRRNNDNRNRGERQSNGETKE
jgi:cell fate regulator YaaT (PSP1 superfamily)